MVDLLAEGDQRHAGYAAADGEFRNAALVLARDLLKLDGLFAERSHPVLGRTTATPTMLDAGVSRNVTPPVAKAILDIRSTPDWTHDEVAARAAAVAGVERRGHLAAPGAVRDAGRIRACSRPRGACGPRRRRSAARPAPTGCSCATSDAIKCGPGTSRRSHTPDEYVDLPEVTAARGVLRRAGAGVPGGGRTA